MITLYKNLYQEEIYSPSPKVLVILAREWEQISEADQLLLGKILGSVRLSLASVQIISRPDFDLNDLQTFSPVQIIAFGAPVKGAAKLYELFSMQGASVIVADDLQKLDDLKKKSLWNALKQMFNR
jgi:hypothetical protein